MQTAEHLTPYQWKEGQSGNPNGRPPKLKSLLINEGLSPAQAGEMINALLMHTRAGLQAIADAEDTPIAETIVARALIRSAERGSLHALETLFTRSHGLPRHLDPPAPTEPVHVTLNLTK